MTPNLALVFVFYYVKKLGLFSSYFLRGKCREVLTSPVVWMYPTPNLYVEILFPVMISESGALGGD